MSRIRRPKWGQHFLKNEAICRRIADSLSLQPDELVVEIGAGRGAMTELVAARAGRLIAVEIDPDLAAALRAQFSGWPQVEVLRADILGIRLAALLERHGVRRCYVFGNLPYYITSPILHHLLDSRASIRQMSLLMQREVAERVTATPGSRAYGYLTVRVQLDAEPRAALAVPPGAFSPVPEVHSTLVNFTVRPRFPLWKTQTHEFLQFAQLCFRQKRKNVLNNLAPKYPRRAIQRALQGQHIKQDVRAEQLGIEELAKLFETVTAMRPGNCANQDEG